MSAPGVLRGRFLRCEVKGGREDPKGRGKGEGLEEGGFIGSYLFMLCRFSVVLLCVFFLISKTGILLFYFKKTDLSNTDLS